MSRKKHLHAAVTGITGIKHITYRDGISMSSATAEITCTAHTLGIGDARSVVFGWDDDFATFINGGIVKKIVQRRPENDYVISIFDKLVLANDYFIAANDPDTPLQYIAQSPEYIVEDLLTTAGVSGSFTSDATGFESGTTENPLKLNCVTAWSVVENMNRITTWMTWVDTSGNVHFQNRKPYIVGGDTASLALITGNSGNIMSIEYRKSDEGIRNRIVVYGKSGLGITATQQASSAYLPADFYKTLVIAHDIIDTQAMADATAGYNLTMFNRLTETTTCEIVGTPTLSRSIVSVTEAFTGFTGDLFFVAGSQHEWSQTGYTATLHLVR